MDIPPELLRGVEVLLGDMSPDKLDPHFNLVNHQLVRGGRVDEGTGGGGDTLQPGQPPAGAQEGGRGGYSGLGMVWAAGIGCVWGGG